MQRYGRDVEVLTPYNKAVIGLIYTLWALNILSSLISIGFWSYYHSSLVQLDMSDE